MSLSRSDIINGHLFYEDINKLAKGLGVPQIQVRTEKLKVIDFTAQTAFYMCT